MSGKLTSLPIWVRIVGTLFLVMAVAVGGLTVWSAREQQRLALKQAQDFATGSVKTILPGIVSVMASGDPAEQAMFFDALADSPGIRSARMIPSRAVTEQFAAGKLAAGGRPATGGKEPARRRAVVDVTPDAAEQRALRSGEPFYGLEEVAGQLVYRAVVPVVARRDVMGKDCLGCHQVQEGTVLGAVSLAIGLEETRRASRDFQRNVLLAAALLGGVLLWGAYVLCTRTITRPLAQVVAQMHDIAEGEGDLTRRLQITSQDEIGELAARFNTFVGKLEAILGQARHAADNVASAAQQMSGATAQLSSGAQEQASSLEETAASLEQMTGTVKQNADNARDASQLAAGSRETAERGKAVVAQAVSGMEEITRASRRIAEIITVIDEIAFQTNLLALNAAVEAARAGEQGRGFAVVATEVRTLAQRSASAAKEIKTLIADSVVKVETGAQLVNRSGETLEEIVVSAKRVSGIVSEIAAASHEQSTGIDQVNRAVLEMDQVVQQNAAQSEELSSTSQALAEQAQGLQELVRRFKLAAVAEPTPVPRPPAVAAAPPVDTRRSYRAPARVELAVATHRNGGSEHDGYEEF